MYILVPVAPFVVAFAYIITAWIRFGTPVWDIRLATSIAGPGLAVPILAVVRTRLLLSGHPRRGLRLCDASGPKDGSPIALFGTLRIADASS